MIDYLIHSPVSYYAANTPTHPALSVQGRTMSYAELDAASNQLANALIKNRLSKQDRVGIFMYKTLDLGVAIYAILKAGGVFVPLDPFMPADRLAFILSDCGITHLISSDEMVRTLKSLITDKSLRLYNINVETPFTSVSSEKIQTYSVNTPDVGLIDQDLAYIMYTSGSTGAPKGMMHTHHGSISYARWGLQHVELTAADRVASHAPLHFDLSIFDFFSTAQAGATVVLVPEQVTKFPASWTEYIQSERISVVFTVPFTLIEMQQKGAMDQRDLSSLRWVLFGGEPYPPKHLSALMKVLPNVRFTNVYGPAEAPSCTCFDIPELADDDERPIPIGTVSRNSADLILDEDNRTCTTGEPGELCIRSSTLTKGYWNRPELNANAFFSIESHGPFPDVYFRTGDFVVRQEDGQLRFLGRKDRMVKTRGHRVELDEVEAAIASHSAVFEAATYTVPDGQASVEIHASVTLKDGRKVDTGGLLQHARTKISAYALPRQIKIVSDLPRTSSGKIDKKQLAEQTMHAAGKKT